MLLLSSLRLRAPHPSSQNQWTGKEVHGLYPGGGRGDGEDSGRRSIRSLSHPPTPPWGPGHASHGKVVLLNELSVPEVWGCPENKIPAGSGTGDGLVPALARTRRVEKVKGQASRVLSLPASRHQHLPFFPSQGSQQTQAPG